MSPDRLRPASLHAAARYVTGGVVAAVLHGAALLASVAPQASSRLLSVATVPVVVFDAREARAQFDAAPAPAEPSRRKRVAGSTLPEAVRDATTDPGAPTERALEVVEAPPQVDTALLEASAPTDTVAWASGESSEGVPSVVTTAGGTSPAGVVDDAAARRVLRSYEDALRRRIGRPDLRRRARSRLDGIAVVSLSVDADGALGVARLKRSSGDADLDALALAHVRAYVAGRHGRDLAPPTPWTTHDVSVPFEYGAVDD